MRAAKTVSLCCALVWIGCGGGGAEIKDDERPEKPSKPVAKTETKPKVELSEEAKQAFSEAVAEYSHQKKTGKYDYDALIVSFKQALEQDPKLAEAQYNLGCIYEAMREDKKAEEHYQKALELRPDLAVAAANWGALLARRGNLDRALQVYERALSKDAKNSAVLLNMATIYADQKQFEKALKKASEVLIRDPGNVGAYRIMASLYLDKGDLDMAHLVCMRGLMVKDKDPRLLNTLGLVLLRLKRVPEALAQFRMALAQEPDMVPTRFNVAKIALDYKDFRVAEEEFKKILEYEPDNCNAAIGLGIAFRGTGKFDPAKAHFENLIRSGRCGAIPHYWLGVVCHRNLNDLACAKKQYKDFLAKGDTGKRADEVRKWTDELAQNAEMEKKIKEAEKKAEEEAKIAAAKEAKLAEKRKTMFLEAWDKAQAECDKAPPEAAKPTSFDELQLVVTPLHVLNNKATKVRLFGAELDPIDRVIIGEKLKVKFQKIDALTIEFEVPENMPLENWDLTIRYKDKKADPFIFPNAVWVCAPKQVPKEEKDKGKEEKAKGKEEKGKGKDEKGEPKEVKGAEKKPEPDQPKDVKETGSEKKRPEKEPEKEPSEEPKEPKDSSTPVP